MPSFGKFGGPWDPALPGAEPRPVSARLIDGPSGQRSSQRHPVVLAASAQAIDGSSSVLVSDLSHQGVKLKGRNLPAGDREVLITTGTFAVFAIVAWSTRDECALSFDPPLSDELLVQFEQEGKWATMMGTV